MPPSRKAAQTTRTADSFFGDEYLAYAVYTIENRAIPSYIDGFKPSQRKIAFAANHLWRGGKGKAMKVFQLGGQAAALSFFHHGSLDQTIIGMVQSHKNSLPIFRGIGQFGSLRAPEAGAPRYVGVAFNDVFGMLYRDFELVESQYEEGERIEPKFFLPIIPTVLLNGTSGIAVGFSTKILNRHPLDLIDACEEVVKTGECRNALHPWMLDFHGSVTPVKDTGRSWAFNGVYEVKNTTTVVVSEIPPGYTYEKYEAVLDAMVEKDDLVSYEDESADRVSYTLKFRRRDLAILTKPDRHGNTKLPGVLKMRQQETENITTLDETRSLRVFDTAQALVEAFVALRMGYYIKRKEHMLRRLEVELRILRNRAAFCKAVIEGRVTVANTAKADLEEQIKTEGICTLKGSYDYLLTMPIYSLTLEKYNALVKRVADKEAERDIIKETTPTAMYLTDLRELRKSLKKVVPPAPPNKRLPRKAAPKPVQAPEPVDAGTGTLDGLFE